MARLSDCPTLGEVKQFLADVEPKTDGEKTSRLNPSLTRSQIWDIFFGAVKEKEAKGAQDSDLYYRPSWPGSERSASVGRLIVRNIQREFGERAKGGAVSG